MVFQFFKNSKKKKKVGLCLSGGGSRGFAHIGVLKAFEENGITFDAISGTSAGSIVGGAYALGVSADKMKEYAMDISYTDFLNIAKSKEEVKEKVEDKEKKFFNFPKFSPAINSEVIENLFIDLCGDKTFEDTNIPLYIVAVSLKDGKQVVLREGSIALSCRASSSVPTVFTPTPVEDMILVDGYVLNNLPADVLKEEGMDIVISVDLKDSSTVGTDSTKYMDVVFATVDIMATMGSRAGIESSDIIIVPDIKGKTGFDLKDETVQLLFNEGYKAAMAKMPQIKKLLKMPR